MKCNADLLTIKVKLLNTVTGNPIEPFTTTEKGTHCNVGCFDVERASGHHRLVQIVSESGGERLLTSGTKGVIVQFIDAYIQGYEARGYQERKS